MNRRMLGALVAALLTAGCADTGTSGEFGRVLGDVLGSPITTTGAPGALSRAEIDAGLREALTVGTNLVARQLGQTNGYYGDPKIRIPLPDNYRAIQTNLAKIGASGPLDDLELRMNRAAESAVPQPTSCVPGPNRACGRPSRLMRATRCPGPAPSPRWKAWPASMASAV